MYEDRDSEEDAPHDPTPEPQMADTPEPAAPTTRHSSLNMSQTSALSEPEEFSEHDEENDPIVHSFGPFGDDILSRFQSFQPQSPERKRKPLKASTNSPSRGASTSRTSNSPVKNHVINQLAFSRVHALPLSTIHTNLPAELRGAMAKPSDVENRDVLTTSELKTLLDEIPCVGEISREGKDAAGKLLESEFYYVPEMDLDEMRRVTVTQSLGKTSIRAARKQHKVCAFHPFGVRLCSRLTSLQAILLEATSCMIAVVTQRATRFPLVVVALAKTTTMYDFGYYGCLFAFRVCVQASALAFYGCYAEWQVHAIPRSCSGVFDDVPDLFVVRSSLSAHCIRIRFE